MIDQILNTKWKSPKELLSFLDINATKIGQGFFSVVYKIDDKSVIKVNSGDFDEGYYRFIKYAINHPSIHFPKVFQLVEIDHWYFIHTELLSPLDLTPPDPPEIILLRELLRNQITNEHTNFEIFEKYKIDCKYRPQINEILDDMSEFDYTGCSIDINLLNIMVRENDWVLVDPITILRYN